MSTQSNYNFKGAVFDLDGTLLDTLADLAASCNYILRQHGLPEPPVDSYRYLVGKGIRSMLEQAINYTDPAAVQKLGAGKFAAMVQELDAHYDQHCMDESAPYPGVVSSLEAMQAKGVKLAVLSNKPCAFVRDMIKHYFPSIQFVEVLGQIEGIAMKPDPVQVFTILDIFDLPHQSVCYVGDTSIDMKTGKSAGLFTIGVAWGFRPRAELIENGADLIIDSPAELVTLI